MKLYLTRDHKNNLTIENEKGEKLDMPVESIVIKNSPTWDGLNRVVITILDYKKDTENGDDGGILKYLDDETV